VLGYSDGVGALFPHRANDGLTRLGLVSLVGRLPRGARWLILRGEFGLSKDLCMKVEGAGRKAVAAIAGWSDMGGSGWRQHRPCSKDVRGRRSGATCPGSCVVRFDGGATGGAAPILLRVSHWFLSSWEACRVVAFRSVALDHGLF